MDWRGLLRQPFVYDAQRGEANKRIVAVARWFLEFSRNLMVVAVLFVIATKSGQWYVYAFAILAGFALWSTVYFYIDPIVPNPVPGRNGSINFLLIILLAVPITLLTVGLSSAIQTFITEVVHTQTGNEAMQLHKQTENEAMQHKRDTWRN